MYNYKLYNIKENTYFFQQKGHILLVGIKGKHIN